jgi:hypothetical protein
MRSRYSRTALIGVAVVALSGCATSAFNAPLWDYTKSTSVPTDVQTYLSSHIDVYDKMIGKVEEAKALLEIPIIPAAVVGTTGLALGTSKDLPIVLGAGGSILSSGSTYLTPRERLTVIVQARAATVCIRREYIEQLELSKALGLLAPAVPVSGPVSLEIDRAGNMIPAATSRTAVAVVMNERVLAAALGRAPLVPTSRVDEAPLIADQVSGVGTMAVAAEDEVVSGLKTKLAGLGAAPDYGAIVTALQQKFKEAEAKSAGTTGVQSLVAGSGGADEAIKKISEYSARLATCKAKIGI